MARDLFSPCWEQFTLLPRAQQAKQYPEAWLSALRSLRIIVGVSEGYAARRMLYDCQVKFHVQ